MLGIPRIVEANEANLHISKSIYCGYEASEQIKVRFSASSLIAAMLSPDKGALFFTRNKIT